MPTSLEPDLHVDLLGPTDVIADEKIELAVVVVVEPGAAGAPFPAGSADPRLRGDVPELAAAQVVEEVIAVHPGDEDVGQAVVVVVAHRDAHAVEADVQSGAGRDVRRNARCRRCGRAPWSAAAFPAGDVAGPVRRIDEQQVLVAVAVVVEKRHAAAH